MPLGRKGFYVATPLVGVVMFLIAALIAVTMGGENDIKIENARSSTDQDKLQFMSEAMKADSFDVLLQNNLEQLTGDFLEDEYFDVNTQETWRQSLRSNLVSYYLDRLGETLGLDVGAYAAAYSNLPSMRRCEVEKVAGGYSSPDVYDSEEGDGTIMVRGYSYGERIYCVSREPEGDIRVDITGRFYRINVRLPELYDLAKWVITKAKEGLNEGIEGAPQPLARWEGPRWFRVKKTDNTLADPGETGLESIIGEWETAMGWFAGRIKSVANEQFKEDNKVGVALEEFEILEEGEGEYDLEDFDVACENASIYRDCMPFRITATLGDTDCGLGMLGEPPENAENPFYALEPPRIRCDAGYCPDTVVSVMEEVLRPVGSVCVQYYAASDAVYPVCKKWKAKAKSVLLKGRLSDDNERYVLAGSDEMPMRFKDQHSSVTVDDIRESRLTCDGDEEDEDVKSYRDNVRKLLEKMRLKLGIAQITGSTEKRWADKGSYVEELDDPTLSDIYKTIYGKGILPLPCFTGESGVRPLDDCGSEARESQPRIELTMDWGETRENCRSRADDICGGLCGGSGTAVEEFKDTFCKGLFPERGTVLGGQGRIRCDCQGEEMDTTVKIESLVFARARLF